jgi:hypothetical protein
VRVLRECETLFLVLYPDEVPENFFLLCIIVELLWYGNQI